MGLKYEILLIPMEVEAFKKAMLQDYGIDESRFLQQDNKDWNEYSMDLKKLLNREEGCTWERIEETLKKQETPEMKAYKERTRNTTQIWFMKCPVRDDWTLCVANYIDLCLKKYNLIYFYYIKKFLKYVEFLIFISFTSVSGGGTVAKHYLDRNGKILCKNYKQGKFEDYQFESFLKRIKNISHYPIAEMHFWLNRPEFSKFIWNHHIRFEVGKELKEAKK